MLLSFQTKEIIKNKTWDSWHKLKEYTSVENDLEMHQNWRTEDSTVVIIDEFSKSPSCDDGEERKEQVRNHSLTNEETIKKTCRKWWPHLEIWQRWRDPKRNLHQPWEC